MPKLLKSFGYFLEKLTSRPVLGGMQITDSGLQYVHIDKEKRMVNFSLRLPPGILRGGKILDKSQFVDVLRRLHDLISPRRKREIVKIVVSLPAELVYTQSLSIPNIAEEKREEATKLNLQMVSPIPPGDAYISSQTISENSDRYEILGAFIDKKIVEDYRKVFEMANFSPIILEFPSLALSRVINQSFESVSGPVLVLQVSSDGLDIFILKDNALYFNYFRSWSSIQRDSKEISLTLFEAVLVEEIQKVINFVLSRFKEIPKRILLLTPGFEDKIKEMLTTRFQIETTPLKITSYPLGPIWYITLGSALRGGWERSKDVSITLGTEGSFVIFSEERILEFVRLWRNIFVGTFAFFLVFFAFLGFILVRQNGTLDERLKSLLSAPAERDLNFFEGKAEEFNNLIAAVGKIKASTPPWNGFLADLKRVTQANGITIDRFNISSLKEPVTLVARAPGHDNVIKFKNFLATEPNFSSVDLPLSQITVAEDSTVVFNISFRYGMPSQ